MADYNEIKKRAFKTDKELKGMIKVVPSYLWLIFVGASIIIVVLAAWIIMGYSRTTVTMTGIYHPGVSDYGEIICFPNVGTGKSVTTGMEMSANTLDGSGCFEGIVTYTEAYVSSAEDMMKLLGNTSLVNTFYQNAPCVCIICKLTENDTTKSGYIWTGSKDGEPDTISDGTFFNVAIATSYARPILDSFVN